MPTSKCNQVTSLIYWLNSQILAHFSVSRNTNKDSCGVSSAACTFHIEWSHGTNNVSLGWRVCKPVLFYCSLHSLVGGGLKTVLFSFWKEVRSLKPVSFLLFLGGSGGRSESSFYAHTQWVLPGQWQTWLFTQASPSDCEQGRCFHPPSWTPWAGGYRQLVSVAVQPEKNTSWKQTVKMGIEAGGGKRRDRQASST